MTTDKRERILQAALGLFVEQGFQGTSTAQVAKKAEVATGTLFHHFKNKGELINTLYGDIRISLSKSMLPSLAEDVEIKQKIREITFTYILWALDNKLEYQLIKHCEVLPFISEDLRLKIQNQYQPLCDFFEDAISNGQLRNLPIELLLNLFLGTIEGFIRYLTTHPKEVKNEALWDDAFSALWGTIR